MGYMILLFAFMLNLPLSHASDADIPREVKKGEIFQHLDNKEIGPYGNTNKANADIVKEHRENAGILKRVKLQCPPGEKVGAALFEALQSKDFAELPLKTNQDILKLPLSAGDKKWEIIMVTLFEEPLPANFSPNLQNLKKLALYTVGATEKNGEEVLTCNYSLQDSYGQILVERSLEKSPLRIKAGTCEYFDPNLQKTVQIEDQPSFRYDNISFHVQPRPLLSSTQVFDVTCEQETRKE